MKNSLPIFAGFALAGVVGVAAGLSGSGGSKEDGNRFRQTALAVENAQAKTTPVPIAAGKALLQNAAATLARYPTVEARVRQKVEIFGQSLIGSGVYQQQGAGLDALVRVEIRMGGADQTSSLLQVGDGRFFWTHVDTGGNANWRRVDIDRVRSAARRGAGQGRGVAPMLSLGGLPRLLASLVASFVWSDPVAVELDRRAAWLVRGSWTSERLAELLPPQADVIRKAQPADLSKLPAHLPTQVIAIVGREDQLLYRIEYRRGEIASDGLAPQLLLSMEFFEFRLAQPIDPRQFHFQPGEQSVFDETERYLTAFEAPP